MENGCHKPQRIDPDPKLDRPCFIVRDADGLRGRAGKASAAKLLTRDEARRIAVNIARLPGVLRQS